MYALIAAFVLAATPAWAQQAIPTPVPLVDKNGVKIGTVTGTTPPTYFRTPEGRLAKYLTRNGPGTIYDGTNTQEYRRVKK